MKYTSVNDIIKGIPLEELAEMCEAKRDGRCYTPPCSPGDTVWVIEPAQLKIIRGHVGGFQINYNMIYFSVVSDCLDCNARFKLICRPEDFGVIIFHTPEAAEAALKGESNDN